jgi:uncharacterized protein YvpB
MLSKLSFEVLLIIEFLCLLCFLSFNLAILLKYFFLRAFANKKNTKEETIITPLANAPSIYEVRTLNRKERKIGLRFFDIFSNKKTRILVYVFFCIFFLITQFFLCKELFFSKPQMVSSYPKYGDYWNDYDKPIVLIYDRPLNLDRLILNISPDTDGEWVYKKTFGFLPFVREVRFVPYETVYPGNEVLVYLADVTNLFGLIHDKEDHISFRSVELPTIVSSQPQDGEKDIDTKQQVIFNLSHKEGSYVDWEFEIEPKETVFDVDRDNSDEIRLSFENDLKQDTHYSIKVFQIPLAKDTKTGEISKKGENSNVYTLNFQTVVPPLVESMSPQGGGIYVDSIVKIVFDSKVEKQSVEDLFSIHPNVVGTKEWLGDRTFVYRPNGLEKATSYRVKLSKGLKSSMGGISEEDVTYSFQTIGNVIVSKTNPANNSSSVGISSSFDVYFNQPVDQNDAQKRFTIEPKTDGVFSWSSNVMKFKPNTNLDYLTSYKVSIAKGVKSIHGLDSLVDYRFVFVSEPKKVVLSVPSYKQTNSKACNLVAARMILAYKGIHKSETQIYSEIAKDSTVCDAENNTWGNPHVGFVGDINGNHDCASGQRGYGVYWGPVSNYLSVNGVSNQVFSGISVSDLAKEIEKGRPAILWWQNGWSPANNISWSTPEGQNIYAVNGMHSDVAIGFIGTSDNPTHFIVNDPWRGNRTLDVSYFKSLWGFFGNTAIVVY